MFTWTLHGDGRTIAPGDVVATDERLGMGRMLGISAQHTLTMFGGTVLFPLLIGLPFTTAVFMSGVGTIIFFLVVRGRVPSYLGSSAAVIGPAFALYAQGGTTSDLLGGIVVVGVVLALCGLVIQRVGAAGLQRWIPPLVTGTVIIMIALNIAPVLPQFWDKDQVIALLTLLTVVALTRVLPGFWSRLAVLLTLGLGYLASWIADRVFGQLSSTVDGTTTQYFRVDWSKVAEAKWFALPDFSAPTWSLTAIGMLLPVVIVLLAENIGHVKAVGEMTGKPMDDSVGRAIAGDGIATALAAAVGGSATTTYAENIGIMAANRIYSSLAYLMAGGFAMVLGCCPKLGAVIYAVPGGVFGGVLVYLVGLIAVVGARTWIENGVDLRESHNYIPAAVGLCLGVGGMGLTFDNFFIGGVALATVLTIVLHQVMAPRSQRATADL